MAGYRVAVIGGDGVGPEVTAVALEAMRTAGRNFGFTIDDNPYDRGGDRYLRTGEVLPDGVKSELAEHDAILLGAVGTPAVPPGVLERGLLLRLRFDFDLYVNLRPVKLYPGVASPIAGLTPSGSTWWSSARTPRALRRCRRCPPPRNVTRGRDPGVAQHLSRRGAGHPILVRPSRAGDATS